jgi:hypothetical protein
MTIKRAISFIMTTAAMGFISLIPISILAHVAGVDDPNFTPPKLEQAILFCLDGAALLIGCLYAMRRYKRAVRNDRLRLMAEDALVRAVLDQEHKHG